MTSIETLELIVQLDPRAAVLGADGLCYKRNNTQAINVDRSTIENSNGHERLQINYSKLINYLSCTEDNAEKLFEKVTFHLLNWK